ncbi:hypothetical protein Tco_1529759, partial [Tanacetum coccineum]
NSVTLEVSSFSSVGKQLAKSCKVKSLDSSGLKDVTRSSETEDVKLKYHQVQYERDLGAKKEDLVSFIRSYKSFSFISFEISSALDSLCAPESCLVPSSIPCYEDMESLGAKFLGSASAIESAEASCPLYAFQQQLEWELKAGLGDCPLLEWTDFQVASLGIGCLSIRLGCVFRRFLSSESSFSSRLFSLGDLLLMKGGPSGVMYSSMREMNRG